MDRRVPASTFHRYGSLQYVGDRHAAGVGSHDCSSMTPRIRLAEEDREHGRAVDDHPGKPRSSKSRSPCSIADGPGSSVSAQRRPMASSSSVRATRSCWRFSRSRRSRWATRRAFVVQLRAVNARRYADLFERRCQLMDECGENRFSAGGGARTSLAASSGACRTPSIQWRCDPAWVSPVDQQPPQDSGGQIYVYGCCPPTRDHRFASPGTAGPERCMPVECRVSRRGPLRVGPSPPSAKPSCRCRGSVERAGCLRGYLPPSV